MSGKKNTVRKLSSPRLKDDYEKDIDTEKLLATVDKALEAGSDFLGEYEEMGDCFYSTFNRMRESLQDVQHCKRVRGMAKVGRVWDFDKEVTGEHYYNV